MNLPRLEELSDICGHMGDDVPLLIATASELGDVQLEQQLRVVDMLSIALPATIQFAKQFTMICDKEDAPSSENLEIVAALKKRDDL